MIPARSFSLSWLAIRPWRIMRIMKHKPAPLAALVCFTLFSLTFAPSAWGQWSSDPALNLALADNNNGSDQVQPKLVPFGIYGGYVSWFDANPATPPPVGYDVIYQRLNEQGDQKF